MQGIDVSKLQNKIKKVLEPKRYEHTLGVAYTAASLAFVYELNTQDALVAGLLHDCAKCLSHKKRISTCTKNDIEITKVEMENPVLLHAKVGAFYAKKKYGIQNEEILNAILYHTTGRPNMGLLEKIIYVADYIEPNRKKLPKLSEIRKIAYADLDMAIYMILENSLKYLEKGDTQIDPTTKETYDFYKDIIEKRGNL